MDEQPSGPPGEYWVDAIFWEKGLAQQNDGQLIPIEKVGTNKDGTEGCGVVALSDGYYQVVAYRNGEMMSGDEMDAAVAKVTERLN